MNSYTNLYFNSECSSQNVKALEDRHNQYLLRIFQSTIESSYLIYSPFNVGALLLLSSLPSFPSLLELLMGRLLACPAINRVSFEYDRFAIEELFIFERLVCGSLMLDSAATWP